jgi:hypothetical protein
MPTRMEPMNKLNPTNARMGIRLRPANTIKYDYIPVVVVSLYPSEPEPLIQSV